jgi:precorrin-6B methylase 1
MSRKPLACERRLTIVGLGLQYYTDLTLGAKQAIESAEQVLYLSSDELTSSFINELNGSSEDLFQLYRDGRDRDQIYQDISRAIMGSVERFSDVCVAFYGHPTLLVTPLQTILPELRHSGVRVTILPGVSAEDWLFASIGLDPSERGWQSYEATEFLIHRHEICLTSYLVLWQVGAVGTGKYYSIEGVMPAFSSLLRKLLDIYPQSTNCTLFEASPFLPFDPIMDRVLLGHLTSDAVTKRTTILIHPPSSPVTDDRYCC